VIRVPVKHSTRILRQWCHTHTGKEHRNWLKRMQREGKLRPDHADFENLRQALRRPSRDGKRSRDVCQNTIGGSIKLKREADNIPA
jgi:hypothetical protein